MEFIANIIGISTQQAWAIFGAVIIAIIIGCTIKYLGRFLIIGAVAVVVLAFLHEHAALNLPMAATQQPQAASEPPVVVDTTASEADPVSAAPSISDEERTFIEQRKASGDCDNTQDCMNLFAEKKYTEAEADQPASDVATEPVQTAAPADDEHAIFMRFCEGRQWPVYACEVQWHRDHPG
jgi:hypothetical protein